MKWKLSGEEDGKEMDGWTCLGMIEAYILTQNALIPEISSASTQESRQTLLGRIKWRSRRLLLLRSPYHHSKASHHQSVSYIGSSLGSTKISFTLTC